MENNSLKNQITVNGNTKAENVFNQLYQNQIALTRLSSAFELIQLSESELDSTYQRSSQITRKIRKKIKMAVSKTGIDLKIFCIMGFMISKKTGEPPVIIDSTKIKNYLRLNYYYFNNGFLTSMQ
jgi:hypothetical protein